ncbi:MAG: hypothetical protein J5829_07495 [Lachnospiraceae bacterium]|nr:hypothetical protein [Lachnospiraceae bacterium]
MNAEKNVNEPEINEENMELTEENLNEAAGGFNPDFVFHGSSGSGPSGSSTCPKCGKMYAFCKCPKPYA